MHHDPLSSSKSKKKPSAGQVKAASKKAQQAAAAKKKAKAKANRQADKKPHKTRPELMAEMLALVAAWFPERRFVLVVDNTWDWKTLPTAFRKRSNERLRWRCSCTA